MIVIENKVNCSGCEACANICPKNCITMVEDEEHFRYPKVDKEKCINCHLCEKICPIKNHYTSHNTNSIVYGAVNKNTTILKKSTSGGMFYNLAKKVIEEGGIVFGVKFNGKENAVFDYATKISDIEQFLGSKYVQAKVKDAYKKAKQFLDSNKTVLFSGCPCQIAGLKSFLKKDYPNLYTCDLVCEGVPNEYFLNIFKNHYETKYRAEITDIQFRNKKYGWMYSGFLLTFKNHKKVYIPRNEVNYLQMLYGLVCVRPSCYDCKFRQLNSGSDFKLADFWKVKNSQNAKYNYYGVSHFLINTKKGEEFFESLKKEFYLYPSSLDEIKNLNESFNTTKFSTTKKEQFLLKTANKTPNEIYDIMEDYIDNSKIAKIKNRIKLKLVKIKYKFKK